MPIYEYRCDCGQRVDRIRKYSERDDPTTCICGKPMTRVFSAHHRQPDGIYSYAPNIGSADAFDRKMAEKEAREKK